MPWRRIILDPATISIELAFSLIVILLCALIFFKTKEMYSLTHHKGIQYFRLSFVFFGLAYFFRFHYLLHPLTRYYFDIYISHQLLMPLALVLTSYVSSMAIIYLTMSLFWKKLEGKILVHFIHMFALLISIVILITGSSEVLTYIQLILLLATIYVGFTMRKRKHFSKLFIIYLLLSVIWALNLIVLGPSFLLRLEWKLAIYLLTVGIFSFITYKVIKWTN
ncbi:MAG: hypothetical protein ABIH34_02080 [Nanoarchaeota archaeon]